MFGLDEAETRRRVTEHLEAMELTNEGGKPMVDFSAGMKKRVAFAAAIIHARELLFLDEPFESIDPAGAAMMKTWLSRIVGQGWTVFITTHVLETVERLCDRVAIVTRPGQLLWEGGITSLAEGRGLTLNGTQFHTLEAMYLHLTGRRDAQLDWVWR